MNLPLKDFMKGKADVQTINTPVKEPIKNKADAQQLIK